MVTDNERRAIAARLRELPDDSTYPDLIGAIADHGGRYAAADAADRLADLIEPPTQCPYYHSGRHRCSAYDDVVDRDALMEQVNELEKCAWYFGLDFDEDEPLRDRLKEASEDFAGCARSIREILEVES